MLLTFRSAALESTANQTEGMRNMEGKNRAKDRNTGLIDEPHRVYASKNKRKKENKKK
jgi:hypothetical protein